MLNIPRPSETIQAVIGQLVAGVVGLLLAFNVPVPDAAVPPIISLLSLVGALITWLVSRRQRTGELASAKDGTVSKPKKK